MREMKSAWAESALFGCAATQSRRCPDYGVWLIFPAIPNYSNRIYLSSLEAMDRVLLEKQSNTRVKILSYNNVDDNLNGR